MFTVSTTNDSFLESITALRRLVRAHLPTNHWPQAKALIETIIDLYLREAEEAVSNAEESVTRAEKYCDLLEEHRNLRRFHQAQFN